MSLRIVWDEVALEQVEAIAERAPVQAEAVVNAVEWMATTGFSLGRSVVGTKDRYWPVPPCGVFYRTEGWSYLRVVRVIDARRRREPW